MLAFNWKNTKAEKQEIWGDERKLKTREKGLHKG